MEYILLLLYLNCKEMSNMFHVITTIKSQIKFYVYIYIFLIFIKLDILSKYYVISLFHFPLKNC